MKDAISKFLKIFFLAAALFATGSAFAIWAPPSPDWKAPLTEDSGIQEKFGNLVFGVDGGIETGVFRFMDENNPDKAPGYVLTRDNAGFAYWAPLSAGSGSDITGSGAVNYLTKWTAPLVLGNSTIYQNGANLGISITNPSQKLHVNGNVGASMFCLPGTAPTGGCRDTWPTGSGMPNPMTTSGDMIIFGLNPQNQPTNPYRLGIGSANQVLTVKNVNGHLLPGWDTEPSGAGPWTLVNPNVYITNYQSNDKVGIGMENPTQQLEITKNFNFPATTASAGAVYVDTSLFLHTSGGQNTNLFLGKGAGNLNVSNANNQGDKNVGIGAGALSTSTPILTGRDNTAVGVSALKFTTSGIGNVAVGFESLRDNTSGGSSNALYRNYAIGHQAAANLETSQTNIAIGSGAIKNSDPDGTLGEFISIGYNNFANNTSMHDLIGVGYNTQSIGQPTSSAQAYGANTAINATASNNSHFHSMIFGDSNVVGWGFGTQPGTCAFKVGTNNTNGNGACVTKEGVWQSGSDIAKKHDVKDITYGLQSIRDLRPVTFKWKHDDVTSIGFIAQEVEKVIPELVDGPDGGKSMYYSKLATVLVRAVQELEEENRELEARIAVIREVLDTKE